MTQTPPVLAATLIASAFAFAQTPPPTQAPASRPDTEVYLAPFTTTGATWSIGTPVNISKSPGYDNQPSFTPDGRAVLFTSFRAGEQSDIYRYDIASAALSRVTATPESEYSPAVTPDGGHISVIRAAADGVGILTKYTLAGTSPAIIFDRIKPVGYHAWVNDHTLALFVLGPPATLQVADTRTGTATVMATDIGRSLLRIPGRASVSFVQRGPAAAGGRPTATIMELDVAAGKVSTLIDAVAGSSDADCAWTPDGWLLMAHGSTIVGWKPGTPPAWTTLGDHSAARVGAITRLAVAPGRDRIAFVGQAPAKPSVVQ